MLGAGPGDPSLITVRALEILRRADVVLYDALVHEDLLNACDPAAEKIFVGKRAGRENERQPSINERLVQEARAGRNVVRLKGGDPYLFGRGSEEAEYLAEHDVTFEVVPGVTSPLAVCAYAGISLTHRELASSVAFITAVESGGEDETTHDWNKLATATDTLVIFMGVRKLGAIMAKLIEHGRSADTPAAVFQWASLPQQATVVGTVGTIALLAGEASIGLPALTVVGDVVRLRERLRWYDVLPLFGKKVLVGRAEEQSEEFRRMLRERGADPVSHPLIRIAPPDDGQALTNAVANAGSYDWVVFTSANAVHAFFAAARAAGRDARVFGSAKVCTIGPATRDALASFGIHADLMPSEYRGEAVADAILKASAGKTDLRVLLPRALVARDVLPDTLRASGATVDVVVAYQTLPPTEDARRALRHAIEHRQVDVVVLTSPSSVENLVAALGSDATALLQGFVIASIGPITSAALAKHKIAVTVSASEYTTPGLLDALERYYTEQNHALPD